MPAHAIRRLKCVRYRGGATWSRLDFVSDEDQYARRGAVMAMALGRRRAAVAQHIHVGGESDAEAPYLATPLEVSAIGSAAWA